MNIYELFFSSLAERFVFASNALTLFSIIFYAAKAYVKQNHCYEQNNTTVSAGKKWYLHF